MQFHMPVKVLFGCGSASRFSDTVSEYLWAKRPLIITDKGLVDSGIIHTFMEQIGSIDLFSEVEANPRSTTINLAGEMARERMYDLIIAIGGGSSLDAGKAIALLAKNRGVIEDYEGKEQYKHDPIPLLAVPTTCGTGSEVTWVSVITDVKRKFKMSIKGRTMFPAVSLVDPDLLKTLPKPLIASTGLDALTHAVEAYTSRTATPFTDIHALKAVELIAGSLEDAFDDISGNGRARHDIMLGSTIAGIAFGNSDVGAVHCIAESVGALYDIPHGVANAIFLPYVMDYNLPECAARYADLARLFGVRFKDTVKAAEGLIRKIRKISARLGIPKFPRLGIDPSDYPLIAKYSFQNNSTPSNIRQITEKDYLDILVKAGK